jgi:dienelactone hydrolase
MLVLLPLILILPGVVAMLTRAETQAAQPRDDEALAREIITNFAAGKFDAVEARFGAQLAAALPLDKLPESWASAIAQFGNFVSIESVRSEQAQGMNVVHVVCKFSATEAEFTMPFDAQHHLAGLHGTPVAPAAPPWIAPDYAKPDSFTERPITVGSSPWTLPGTLTLPKGAGPFPAVVLVHGSGSGSGDQDETIGPNKVFKDLAWGLASRGIAVLRYTKRTRQYGAEIAKNPAGFTVKQETEEDARAAASLLSTFPEVDSKHIYVIGHSLGAYLAPRIASGDPQIAGIILMAGTTRPLEDVVLEQVRNGLGRPGGDTPEAQKAIADAEQSKREIEDPNLKPGMTVHMLGVKINSEYFLDLRGYNPGEVAASLKIPILVLQGERDIQVRMIDFNGWQKALAGHSNATFKTYPSLTHLFMPGIGPSTGAEYMKANHVLLEVVEDIAAWVRQQSTAHAR